MRVNLVVPALSMRSSLGFVKDYSPQPGEVQLPLSDYNTLLSMVRNDEIISTAFETVRDTATQNGFHFVPKSNAKNQREIKRQLDEATSKFEELNWSAVENNLWMQWQTF